MSSNAHQEYLAPSGSFLLPITSLGIRLKFRNNELIFSQGDHAETVYLLERGRVKLTAVSHVGRQATISVVSAGMFFGESCLANVQQRRASATAITDCVVLRISTAEFVRVLREKPPLSDCFISHLVQRNARYEEDLLDQLFNCGERRLARILLLLAHFDAAKRGEKTVSGVTQQTLAEMVGTTRAHINVFMSKFRRMGFVDYDRHTIRVRASLISRLLSD